MADVTQKSVFGRAASTALLLGAAFGLQGCIAAAFPLAASGVLGERTLSRGSGDKAEIDPSVEVATSTQEEELVNSDLAPVVDEPATATPPPTSVSADFNAAFADQPQNPGSPSQTTQPSDSGEAATATAAPSTTVAPAVIASNLPPAAPKEIAQAPQAEQPTRIVRPLPTPVPSAREPLDEPMGEPTANPDLASSPSPSSIPSPSPSPDVTAPGASAINQFLSYANQRQIGTNADPEAAVLSDRLTLEPVKAKCNGVSPTVLIDLDPSGGLFDPANASRPPSGLARGLAQLRLSGVSVAWISGNKVEALDAINRSLAFSGLDIRNEDRILLVRSADDRKQTLRNELAQISCLIAIAGDTRSDFDELYDYLKNPSDAKSLEPLIGDGWFIIPQPLL